MSARDLGNERRRIVPMLRPRGISVTFSRTRGSRLITINAEQLSDHSSVTHNTNDSNELW
jgi:hypothetical protein